MSLITWIKNLFATKEEAAIPATVEPAKKHRARKPTKQAVKKTAPKAPKAPKPVDSMETVSMRWCRTLTLSERQAIGKTVETLGYDSDVVSKLHNVNRIQAKRIVGQLKVDKDWANTYELHQLYDREDCMMVYFLLQIQHDPREVGKLFGISGNQVNTMVKELCEDDKRAALKWLAFPTENLSNTADYNYWVRHLSAQEKARLLRLYRKLVGGIWNVSYIPQIRADNTGATAGRCKYLLLHLCKGVK